MMMVVMVVVVMMTKKYGDDDEYCSKATVKLRTLRPDLGQNVWRPSAGASLPSWWWCLQLWWPISWWWLIMFTIMMMSTIVVMATILVTDFPFHDGCHHIYHDSHYCGDYISRKIEIFMRWNIVPAKIQTKMNMVNVS